MQEFIDYWAAHHEQQDDGKILYDKHQRALAAIEDSRRKTLKYIIPVNGSKGWHPGFDPEATAEIVALAAEIEAANSTLKSVSQNIEEFMAVVGCPISRVLGELQVAGSGGSGRGKAVSVKVDGLKIELNNLVVPDAGATYHLTDILKRELDPYIEERVKRMIGQYIM